MISAKKGQTQNQSPRPNSPNTTNFINMIVAQKSKSIQRSEYCPIICYKDTRYQRNAIIDLTFDPDYKLDSKSLKPTKN